MGVLPRLALVVILLGCGRTDVAPSAGPIMRGIDHVYVPANRPRELVALLRDTLGLPEARPLAERGGGTSAGLSLGNVVLEVLERPDAGAPGIEGIGLWPTAGTEVARAHLARGGLAVGRSVRLPRGADGGWVLTGLGDFPEGNVFLCEYLDTVSARGARTRGAAALDAARGGRLGLAGMREVIIMARDVAGNRARWRALGADAPASAEPSGAALAFAMGPAVRIVPGDHDAIAGMVLAVRDTAAARAAWPPVLAALGVSFVPAAAERK